MLSVSNIESYYGPIMAIRGISLEVPRQKIVAVLGANGAGKTTLLKTISGIMEPEKGAVMLEGQAIDGDEPAAIVRKGVAHVPEGREIFPLLSVRDNLRLGAYTRPVADGIAEDMQMVFEYFPILEERARQMAGTLSGGQQQMLAIARGMMTRPRIMLLDEPSLGLSPLAVKEIFSVIRRLNVEQGVTMLLVEQNAHAALELADYGYVLELGRVVMEGSSSRLLSSPDIQEFYLGVKEGGQRGQRRWKRRKTWR
ncbi:MAG: ABC transporter ATP-binding protein [Boseongicola sp. SB0667_bin_21]|nr:ABC transporter ATP-binding protein [Boseongicola sp. SB0667_bin_21]